MRHWRPLVSGPRLAPARTARRPPPTEERIAAAKGRAAEGRAARGRAAIRPKPNAAPAGTSAISPSTCAATPSSGSSGFRSCEARIEDHRPAEARCDQVPLVQQPRPYNPRGYAKSCEEKRARHPRGGLAPSPNRRTFHWERGSAARRLLRRARFLSVDLNDTVLALLDVVGSRNRDVALTMRTHVDAAASDTRVCERRPHGLGTRT